MMYNNAYVLPVRYNNGGDYSIYELPQEESTRHLHRVARQAPTPDASISERIRASAAAFRERASRLMPASDGSDRVGSTLGSSLSSLLGSTSSILGSTGSMLGSTLGATNNAGAATSTDADQSSRTTPINVAAMREKFTALAEPIGQFVGSIRDTIASSSSSRTKRDTTILSVKEYNPSNDQTRFSKYMNMNLARVELQTPEHHEVNIREMEKASHCHSCGSKLMDSVCTRCGSYQPQYIEYIEGKQVPFYPGAVQSNNDQPQADSVASTRYIFDRYGHKYLENEGKLRLVRNQPDYAGLADILNQNREVMQQLNPAAGRLMPQPVEIVTDLTQLIRQLARNQGNAQMENKNQEKRSTTTTSTIADSPRSMYQVVPMQYDGKDGKLVVKIYDNQNEMAPTTADETTYHDRTNMMEETPPTVKKFAKNNKEFEILTFNDYKGTADDDIRRVLEHLHGKQQ